MPQWIPRVVLSGAVLAASVPTAAAQTGPSSDYRALLDRYCASCHNQRLHTANLNLDKTVVDLGAVANHAAVLEKVLQKLQTGSMPPPGLPRPAAATYREFAGWLETELDRAAAARPNPGRPTAHRLNRAEYTNAVRDLLALDIDARVAAADRRPELRIRQQRRPARAVAGIARTVPVGGATTLRVSRSAIRRSVRCLKPTRSHRSSCRTIG